MGWFHPIDLQKVAAITKENSGVYGEGYEDAVAGREPTDRGLGCDEVPTYVEGYVAGVRNQSDQGETMIQTFIFTVAVRGEDVQEAAKVMRERTREAWNSQDINDFPGATCTVTEPTLLWEHTETPTLRQHAPDRGDQKCLLCKEPWPCDDSIREAAKAVEERG